MRFVASASSLCCCVFLLGCVNVLHPYNQPSKEKLRIQSSTTLDYIAVVADTNVYPFAIDGRLTIDVPRLERGCATYFLGMKVRDFSCYDVPAIRIEDCNHATIRTLSLNQLRRLPIDDQGYHLIKVQ